MTKILFNFFLLSCSFSLYSQVTFYGNPEPVEALNSPSGENYLHLTNSGSTLYFSREKHSGNSGGIKDVADIWKSELDSAWGNPENLKINGKDFASPLGITSDDRYFLYNKVWFDKTRFYGGVYATELNGSGKEIEVEIPYFKNRSPLQTGNLSADGRYLLLSLENNTGYGVDDLFVSFLRENGTWSPAKNLGRVVNTQFQELTPFLAADNKTLFFASNGRGGEGSFDLFKTHRLDDTWQNWSEPENLGTEVNTPGAETSFVFVQGAEYAYFVSTQNSDGYGDVKRIKITADIEKADSKDQIAALVIEEEGRKQAVTFQLVDSKTGSSIPGKAIVLADEDSVTIESNSGGQVTLPYSEENVSLEFKSPGYLSVRQTIDQSRFTNEDQEVWEINMEPLSEGNTITLKNVLFYRGTANFIEGSERELELVVEMMKENPEVDIFLKGHTDNVGNPVMNIQLSQQRVEAVMDFLVQKGITTDRITGKGFGGSEPIAGNDAEATRKLNRRVEFEIRRD